MKKLGKSQQAVYDYIVDSIKNRAIPPTVREICAAVGLSSTATVQTHLKALEAKGYINISHGKQRSITLADNSPAADAAIPTKLVTTVPLVGRVAAGLPILAEENIEEELCLPDHMLHGAKRGEIFCLTVEGESMRDIGIMNGDKILVHRGMHIENGDIVVALVGGESATVKRFYVEKDKVRLQPENEHMQPIFVDFQDIELIGKVIGLTRSY